MTSTATSPVPARESGSPPGDSVAVFVRFPGHIDEETPLHLVGEGTLEPCFWRFLRGSGVEIESFSLFNESKNRRIDPDWTLAQARLDPGDRLILSATDDLPQPLAGYRDHLAGLKARGTWPVDEADGARMMVLRAELQISDAEHATLAREAGFPPDDALVLWDWKPVEGRLLDEYRIHLKVIATGKSVGPEVGRKLMSLRELLAVSEEQHLEFCRGAGMSEELARELLAGATPLTPTEKVYHEALKKIAESDYSIESLQIVRKLVEEHKIARDHHFRLAERAGIPGEFIDAVFEEPTAIPPGRKLYSKHLLDASGADLTPDRVKLLESIRERYGIGRSEHAKICRDLGFDGKVAHTLWEFTPPSSSSLVGWLAILGLIGLLAFLGHPDGRTWALARLVDLARSTMDNRYVGGFDKDGFDPTGYDRSGFNKAGYNREGYDKSGYSREGRDVNGYDRSGHDRDGYDKDGFDKDGFNRRGFNQRGMNREGLDAHGYDPLGYDRAGFDSSGYNRDGFNREGYTREGFDGKGYDRRGFDRHGRDRNGFDRAGLDAHGFDRGGYNQEGRDTTGFDRQGYDVDGYDRQGYARDGFSLKGLDKDGFDRDGFGDDGFNRAGFDRFGYDRDGYNKQGLDRNGYNRAGKDRYGNDRSGIGANGRDAEGYDRDGFDVNGYTRAGFDRDGRDREGRDRDGFDRKGYNRAGFDRDGYDKDSFNKDGFDRSGYNRSGYSQEGIHRSGRDLLPGRLSLVKDQTGRKTLMIDGYQYAIGDRVGPFKVRLEKVGQVVQFSHDGSMYGRQILK